MNISQKPFGNCFYNELLKMPSNSKSTLWNKVPTTKGLWQMRIIFKRSVRASSSERAWPWEDGGRPEGQCVYKYMHVHIYMCICVCAHTCESFAYPVESCAWCKWASHFLRSLIIRLSLSEGTNASYFQSDIRFWLFCRSCYESEICCPQKRKKINGV